MLDSIARNYPIGSILLWQSRNELASERAIAGLAIAEAKPDYPVNYLLDGQQRISSVCGALHWRPSSDPLSMWNTVYDLRGQKFYHLNSLDDPPLSQVPLRYFSEPATFFKRTSALDDEELRNRAEALFNRFQENTVPIISQFIVMFVALCGEIKETYPDADIDGFLHRMGLQASEDE